MRKILYCLFSLWGVVFYAQNQQSKNQLFVGAGTAQKEEITKDDNTTVNLKLNFQVGSPLLFNRVLDSGTNASILFPYSILYKSNTFVENQVFISKGFYADMIKLSWEIAANKDAINTIKIYRKELGASTPEQLIATLAKDVFEYEDQQIEASTLYEYRIFADGIAIDGEAKEFLNFARGIGFRNPTAIVTGNVSFKGGNPVKDVTLFAENVGANNDSSTSKSMYFKGASAGTDIMRTNFSAVNTTLQGWVNLSVSDTLSTVFTYQTTATNTFSVGATLTSENTLKVHLTKNNTKFAGFTLNNAYPTGAIDPFGKDVYKSIASISEEDFVHFSIALENNKTPTIYINGRPITSAGLEGAVVSEGISQPTLTDALFTDYTVETSEKVQIFDLCLQCNKATYLDEVRFWDKALTALDIRRDYRRYLSGGENNLKIYLRGDEGYGDFLYDLSKKGFTFNENHVKIRENLGAFSFSTTKPRRDQLGIFGVTDKNGNYTIASISYSGNGESFEITPSLGVHEFNPATQTLFLGKDAPVVNKIDFTDISSFAFRGKALYDVRNVFESTTDEVVTGLRDHSYNSYIDADGAIYNKGEYYYEGGSKDASSDMYKEGVFKKYPVIGLSEANVYIDGSIVFDADNQPVVTDSEGNFNIQVPIGNHKIEVKKDGHVFTHNGRFPETGTFEFFEDQIERRYFVDETRVTLVGRVVGGKREFDKPIGFGFNDKKTHTNFEGLETQNEETISSVNNIGVASIILKGAVESSDLDFKFTTNEKTGEFKVSLIPYKFSIKPSDLKITSNRDLDNEIINVIETLDLREVPEEEVTQFTTKDGTILISEPYHYQKSFRYDSPVTLTLLKQEFETELEVGGEYYDVSALEVPIYNQNNEYNMEFEVSQNYVNKDDGNGVVTKEFFTEGKFNITNQLELRDNSTISLSENGKKYTYSFIAGEANVSREEDFKKSMTVQYVIDGQNPLGILNSNDFKDEGIIIGGSGSGEASFVTSAPEIPDIILRDPPGSNSFASIEEGTTISFVSQSEDLKSKSVEKATFTSTAPTASTSIGTPILSIGLEVRTVKTEDEGIVSETKQINKNTFLNSYTFTKTISTSDDPNFVGADGDLYIGNAKNLFFGSINNVHITDAPLKNNDGSEIPYITVDSKDTEGETKTLYISTRENMLIGEQPTGTFFTYSQKYILETLIPELENLANNYVEEPDPDLTKIFVTADSYREQAELWKKIIQDNEKTKFEAKDKSEQYREMVLSKITDYVQNSFASDTLSVDDLLAIDVLRDLVSENFDSNRSFDAGLGEFTTSLETITIVDKSFEYTKDFTDTAVKDNGIFVNNAGRSDRKVIVKKTYESDINLNTIDNSTTISYTLKDDNRNNFLSVDILNMFDGNGPVFITKGGATSCPYEGETTSLFYEEEGYNANEIGEGGEILSVATNDVYKADFSVEKQLITNVPEDDSAVFTILLKNTSQTQSDLEFVLDYDPTSLNGAEINLETNGVNVFLPFNETIEFPVEISKTSSSSIYDYENIRLYLYSPCAIADEKRDNFLDISAKFKKSCSNVTIASPEENWVFNINEAYTGFGTLEQTTNSLPITFTDFSTDFTGFQKIELQYRNASSSNWIKLASYNTDTNSQSSDVILINESDAEITYNWDIVNDEIPDGNYEFRAVSYCTNNIINTSAVVSGTINLNPPVVFGTPNPTDGILDVGEDITLRFNEDILKRITSSISVTGLKNQQEIDHSVSVRLDGTGNQIELPNQRINNQSFTLQFWHQNVATSKGILVQQEDGIQIAVDNDFVTFSIGEQTVATQTNNKKINSTQYNFYSFVYENSNTPKLFIFENGEILVEKVLSEKLDINTSASIFIGDQGVSGNIHDIRLWSQTFTPAKATVAKDLTLTGRELNLKGYWKLDEGNGVTGLDKAKRRNALVNLNWDIKPKGNGYEFKDNGYLSLENVGFIQPTHLEDISLSFWIKPDLNSVGTIFSNGVGDDSDSVMTNTFRNKWSFEYTINGQLELHTEGAVYPLTIDPLTANTWSHIAVSLKRGGFLTTYVNANQVNAISASKIGGFTGSKILVGAKLNQQSIPDVASNYFTGKLDEIRFWNTARTQTQIARDRYFELDKTTPGLLLYLDFNKEETNTTNGPRYYHADRNLTIGSTYAVIKEVTTQLYVDDSPAIKPPLKFTNISNTVVINGDEMIIQPDLTDEEWSLFEGEILNFTVEGLTDVFFNKQLSPVTWTALVNRQEIAWFTEAQTKEIVAQKNVGDPYQFTMDIVNIGGSNQPFTISGLPTWITPSFTSGSVSANTNKQVTFTVDENLAMGSYTADIFLETASGYNDRLSFELRVLTDAPDWSVNPRDYDYSMNIIGKIKIDGDFSRDTYTKVGAFVNDVAKGEAYLEYDAFYDSYFAYLTIYNENAFNDKVTFKLWDAVNGKIINAFIGSETMIDFMQNTVLGTSSNPEVFSNSSVTEQNITLNKGWSWLSFYAKDTKFASLATTLSNLDLSEKDAIKSQLTFANYEDGQWNGNLTMLSVDNMYKIKLAKENNLRVVGEEVDPKTYTVDIAAGWNWLSYPIHRNISLQEALAFYDTSDGDVIKDQFNFAIYDQNSGWRGSLDYLESGKGYMIKSGKTQVFKYPDATIAQRREVSTNQSANTQGPQQEYFRNYSATMSIVAEVVADQDFTNISVFDANNILRGIAEIEEIAGKKYSFITVFGDQTEPLYFELSDGSEKVKLVDALPFLGDKVVGNFTEPYVLSLKGLSVDTAVFNEASIYPNPFTNQITIDVSAENEKLSSIEIYNTIGISVYKKKVLGINKTVVTTSDFASGIYLVRLTTNTGKTMLKKMIKK
ncbi:LamG-like jellyroll fold domain-containing protein [uncultured Polaribacter sp.]|uniref:LamG-like jellyroll fold domain-containing protein n=1 Tax=uncultured Polaribacter sp. TaxID=174711 RepID=UPI0026180459|nr:LamG-like jellyroll fold domain-containing protein [uncultured Polaribacter sp.]